MAPIPRPPIRSFRRRLAGLCALACLAASSASAQGAGPDLDAVDWSGVVSEVEGFPGVPLFRMPRVYAETRVVAALATAREDAAALRAVDRLIARYPLVDDFHATRAILLSRLGRDGEALVALDRALDLGYEQLGRLRRTPEFNALTSAPGFRDLAARDRAALPVDVVPTVASVVRDATARVSVTNTRWVPGRAALEARFRFAEPRLPAPSFGPESLRRRIEGGEAAGLAGLLYDNRDRGHSTLGREAYPGLAFVEYDEAAQAAGVDYGPNRALLFDAIAFGNSSTAMTSGAFWRSQPRALVTERGGPRWLETLYRANHVYVYPEHRDHDPVRPGEGGGHGDLFPANTPFFVVSQGSSGSDKRFLEAIAHILAAMRPETRADLARRGLIAPTVQMVLRRGMAPVADDADTYLSPVAHPTAFPRRDIDLDTMRAIAARLTPATTPPAAVVGVLNDLDATEGVDVFAGGADETLFDTAFARGRVWRSTAHTRSLLLAAGAYGAFEGMEVGYRWRVLRGDPDKVRITPLGPNAERARVEIDWHDRVDTPGRPDLPARRIDIGVFVDVGTELSAPAFVSIALPPDEARRYEDDGAGGRRIAEIDYAPEAAPSYVDPLLYPLRAWRDVYRWRGDGTLDGWTRHYDDPARAPERYTGQGFLILETDAAGRPAVLGGVDYTRRRRPDGRETVTPTPSAQLYRVVYPAPEATEGALVPIVERDGENAGAPSGG